VRFYGLDEDKDEALVFMLMDYIEGTTLRKEIYKSKQPFTAGRVLEVMRPVCSALHYAHAQGIVHCDVKPGNIMMDTQGGILLSDLACPHERIGYCDDGRRRNSGLYGARANSGREPDSSNRHLCPWRGAIRNADRRRTAIHRGKANTTGSTGEKLRWEQLNRKPPSPRKINPEISTDLEAVVLKCLQKEPASRQADVLELLNELSRTILSSGTIASEHPSAER